MQLWFAVEPDALAVVHVDAATEWHARQLLGRVFASAPYARRIPTAEARRLLIASTHFGCRVFLNDRGPSPASAARSAARTSRGVGKLR